jgi:hypothetical protein
MVRNDSHDKIGDDKEKGYEKRWSNSNRKRNGMIVKNGIRSIENKKDGGKMQIETTEGRESMREIEITGEAI